MIFIGLIVMAISALVGYRLKSKFKEYSMVGLSNGLSGKEIAEKMLRDNGIFDVRVLQVDGQLTDHYNPADKTVNLSADVFHGRSVAAAAVSAHECGHAVQHATAYSMLQFRSSMVPILQIASSYMHWIIMIGAMMVSTSMIPLTIGVALFALTTIFSLITLPVEYDASNRALKWIKEKNIVNDREYGFAADSLKWAARTYLVAAVGSIAQLLYLLSMLTGRSDD
jgi:uncharacterized protein